MSSAQGHLPVRRAAKAGENATIYQIVTTKDTFLDTDTGFQATVRMTVGTTVTTILYADLSKYSLSLTANIDNKTTITQITPQGVIAGFDLTNAIMINLILTDTRTNQVVAERHLGVYHGGEEGQPGAAAETFALIVTPQSVAYNPKTNATTSGEKISIGVSHTVGSEQTMLTVDEMTKYNCRIAVYIGKNLSTLADENIVTEGLELYPYHVTNYDDEYVYHADINVYKAFKLVLYVNDSEVQQATVLMLGDGQAVYNYASEWKQTNDKWISDKAITTDDIEGYVNLYTSTISQTAVQIQALVTDSAGTGGIKIESDKVTLYGDKVQIKSSHGDNIASFQMIGSDGCINTDIINADKIVAKQLQCIRSGLTLSTASHLISTINRTGDGAFEIFHPTKISVIVNKTIYSEDVPAMRIVLENITIDGTSYTALIQVYNTDGQLIWALTTIGIINVDLSSASFRPVSLVSGLTESQANSINDYTSKAKTYYRVSTNDDNNGRLVTQECAKTKVSSYLVTNTVLYEPRATSHAGINTKGENITYYVRRYYTIDSSGNVASGTYTLETHTNSTLTSN
jgi:hypothetical protein